MMTFEDRERAFEAKYAHDEDFRFRLTARRDKLFARWAIEQVGFPDEQAAEFLQSVLAVPDREDHDQLLVAHVHRTMVRFGFVPPIGALSLALRGASDQARAELLAQPIPQWAF